MSKSSFLSFVASADSGLQAPWNLAQLGVALLPLSPFLGTVGIILAMLGTWRLLFPAIIRDPLNRGFAILAGWLVLTACFADRKVDAFEGLFNFLPFFPLFAAFSPLIYTPRQLRRIAWILVIGSLPVIIIGLGQLYWGWAGHPQLLWIVLDWQLQPTGNPPGRMASVFKYANVLASYLVVTFILALGLWIEAYQAFTRGLKAGASLGKPHWAGFKKVGASVGFLSVAVMGNAIALILTNSRNAWAIAGFACLAFALYLQWHWFLGAIAGASGGVLWSAFGPDPVREWLRAIVPAYFWARITDQLYPDRPIATLRTTQWHFAWDMTVARPWMGWGLRNFNPLYQAQMHEWLGHPHNLFLMLTAETGIPATLLFGGLVGWVLARAVLLLRDWQPVSALPDMPMSLDITADKLLFFTYLVAFFACTIFHLFDVPLFDLRINVLGWLLLAAIAGLSKRKDAIAPNSNSTTHFSA